MSLLPAFSATWPWLVLAAIPIGIVLMYFLKLRREVVEVPSTYLWSRTIEDLHVNSLLQRLRHSVLLALQLLAVALVALALLRPGAESTQSSLGRMVFLLDASASMQAPAKSDSDADDDSTATVPSSATIPDQTASSISRFESARQQIRRRIDAMSDQETAMLVQFSDRAEVMQAFTSDRNRLRAALDRCEVTNRPTDILGALNAADGLANPKRTSEEGSVDVQVADAQPADLLLFSDGNFQDVTEFSLGNLVPTYFGIGSTQIRNLAIVNFSAERNLQDATQIDVFATILNAGTVAASADVSLMVNGELVDAASVALDPEDQTGLSFEISGEGSIQLACRLDIQDDLAIDNEAYAALTPSGLASVLVITPGNRPLEIGLTTDNLKGVSTIDVRPPDYLQSPDYVQRSQAGTDDVIIYDRCRPKTMPSTNTFFIGSLPPVSDDPLPGAPVAQSDEAAPLDANSEIGWSWSGQSTTLTLVDVNRTHPLMRYLELYSLLIFSGRSINAPAGSVALIESDAGTVMWLGARRGYQDLVLGFPIVAADDDGGVMANTNWYAERSWPVFLLNMLQHLGGASASSGAPSYQPGETVLLRLESAIEDVTLRRQSGNDDAVPVAELRVGEGGMVELTQTATPGNYQLIRTSESEQSQIVDQFTVNLFDIRESTLATRQDVEVGYETVEAVNAGVAVRQDYWRWLLLTVLAVLAIEWVVYGRRVS